MLSQIVSGDRQRSPAANVGQSAAPTAASRDTCGSPSEQGSPFLVSGELFLRSTPQLFYKAKCGPSKMSNAVPTTDKNLPQRPQQRQSTAGVRADPEATGRTRHNQHPSAGLLGEVSNDLRNLLLCNPDVQKYGGNSKERKQPGGGIGANTSSEELVSKARTQRRLARVERIKQLNTSTTIVDCMAAARLNAAQKAAEGFRIGCNECRARLDERLGRLVLRYAATMRAEMAAEDVVRIAESEHCRREQERLELAARLASLAVTADHRTRGGVVLRRLPQAHPQHARCLRAATENVKAGYFSSAKSPYGSVRVLDIYKIENRFLLERFQRAANMTDPCKVKGLFCHVPHDSLEYVVMFGMGARDDGGGGESGGSDDSPFEHEVAADLRADPMLWATKLEGSRRGEENRARACRGVGSTCKDPKSRGCCSRSGYGQPLQFPRAFSRYSTLDEEREYVNDFHGSAGLSGCGSPGAVRTDQNLTAASWRAGGGASGRGDGDVSGLRLLALCRVMIRNMYVSPSPLSDYQGCGRSAAESSERKGAIEGFCRGIWPQSAREQSGHPSQVLPRSREGEREYDALYFPHEEEYLLLNPAFVLPEFLVVHRFVAAPTTLMAPTSGNLNADSTISSSAMEESLGSRVAAGSGGRDTKNKRVDVPLPVVASSRLQPVAPGSSSSVTARSVVTEMKTAINRWHANGSAGPSGAVPSTAGRVGHCRNPCGAVDIAHFWGPSAWNTNVSVESTSAIGAKSGDERQTRREYRETIEREFKSAFECAKVGRYCQEVAQLREAEQREVEENAAVLPLFDTIRR